MRAVSRRFVGVALLVGLLGTVVFGGTASAATADANTNWGAILSSGNEIPTGDSGAWGIAYLNVGGDGASLNYTVTFWNIVEPQMGHIHVGNTKTNGPVVVNLFDSKTIKGTYSGMIASGTVTAKDLVGPMQGKGMDALLAEIKSGNTYVNFHTAANPGGAARGQVTSFQDNRLLG